MSKKHQLSNLWDITIEIQPLSDNLRPTLDLLTGQHLKICNYLRTVLHPANRTSWVGNEASCCLRSPDSVTKQCDAITWTFSHIFSRRNVNYRAAFSLQEQWVTQFHHQKNMLHLETLLTAVTQCFIFKCGLIKKKKKKPLHIINRIVPDENVLLSIATWCQAV